MAGTTGIGRACNARMAVAVVTAIGMLGGAGNATAATVGGGAMGLKADVDVLGLVPLHSGPVPSVTLPADGGGPITANLLSTNLLGLATVDVAKVSTKGATDPGSADSSALVANADVAGLVKAKVAESSCGATASSASGTAKVVDLVVAGIPIAVQLGANTTISLPLVGTVIINEQTSTSTAATTATPATTATRNRRRAARRGAQRRRATTRAAGSQSITVNAVHVKLDVLGLAKGDVILAQSRCSVG